MDWLLFSTVRGTAMMKADEVTAPMELTFYLWDHSYIECRNEKQVHDLVDALLAGYPLHISFPSLLTEFQFCLGKH
jgi:hypothetical protein